MRIVKKRAYWVLHCDTDYKTFERSSIGAKRLREREGENMKGLTENIVTAVQNIGTAAWFGGISFGSIALAPAVEVIDDERERGELMQTVWRRYSPVAWLGLGSLAATTIYWWSQPRRRLSETEVQIAKLHATFLAGAITATAASAALGRSIAQQDEDGPTPIISGYEPSPAAPTLAQRAQRAYPALTAVNLICGIGLLACSALLSHRKHSNTSWLW
jgi:hypothetical protein